MKDTVFLDPAYDSIFSLTNAAIESTFVNSDRCSDSGQSERRSVSMTAPAKRGVVNSEAAASLIARSLIVVFGMFPWTVGVLAIGRALWQ